MDAGSYRVIVNHLLSVVAKGDEADYDTAHRCHPIVRASEWRHTAGDRTEVRARGDLGPS